jgi:hypothetical protein
MFRANVMLGSIEIEDILALAKLMIPDARLSNVRDDEFPNGKAFSIALTRTDMDTMRERLGFEIHFCLRSGSRSNYVPLDHLDNIYDGVHETLRKMFVDALDRAEIDFAERMAHLRHEFNAANPPPEPSDE